VQLDTGGQQAGDLGAGLAEVQHRRR
jgi:hypothetical protein